jgi:hypothetical protein
LEGDSQLWYQLIRQGNHEISQDEFKERLYVWYGPSQFFNPFHKLTRLQQSGTTINSNWKRS